MDFACGFLTDDVESWEVNPTTRCVVAPTANRDVIEVSKLHASHGDRLFKRLNPEFGKKYTDVPELTNSQLKIAIKLEHELDHLQRHLATGYGYLFHAIKSRMVDLFFERLHLTCTDEAGVLPWYPESAVVDGLDLSDSGIEGNKSRQLGYRWLAELLSGESLAPRRPSAAQCAVALAVFQDDLLRRLGYKGNVNIQKDLARELSFDAGSRFEFPTVAGRDGRPEKIGGQALLEAFSICREMSQMTFAGRAVDRDLTQFRAPIYTSAMRVWQNIAGLPRVRIERPSGSWKAVGYKSLDVFPLDVYAAADLALWPPIEPNPETTDLTFNWHDIHPGWRYVRCLNYLKKNPRNWMPPRNLTADTDSWMVELQRELCLHFGWKSPVELSHSWFQFLSHGHSGGFGKLFIADDRGRSAASLNLLNTRIAFPARFALGFPASHGHAVNWFACLLAADESRVYSDEQQEQRLEQLGYKLPVAFAMMETLELYGEKLNTNRDVLSQSVQMRFKQLGHRLDLKQACAIQSKP